MKMKRQLALVVAACMVASSLVMLVPMAKPWTTLNTSTSATVPMSLTLNAPASFAFNNDTSVATFSIVVGNASTSPGAEYNLTVWAGNGTTLNMKVYVNQQYSSGGCNWIQTTQVGSTITVHGENQLASPVNMNGSMVITAVTQVTLCIQIIGTAYQNKVLQTNGGSIQIVAISGYQQTMAQQSPTTSPPTFTQPVNVSALTGVDGSVSNYALEFNVSTSGGYYVQANATGTLKSVSTQPTTAQPGFTLYILKKNAGVPGMISSGVVGVYSTIGQQSFSNNGSAWYTAITLYEGLVAGTQYVLYIPGGASIGGELTFCNVTALPLVTGAIGSSVTVDFSSSNAIQTDLSDFMIFVSLPALKYDTMYSVSLSAPNWPWYASVSGTFSLNNGLLSVAANKRNNMQNLTGAFLVTQDKSPDLTIDGQLVSKSNPEFTMVRDWSKFTINPGAYYNMSSVASWSTGSVNTVQWAQPGIVVMVSNLTGTPAAIAPGSLQLTLAENATNVPTFTGSASSGDSNYNVQTLAFSNNGGLDDMGLYKLPSKKGNELQIQVTSIACIPLQSQVGPTNTFTIQFATGNKESSSLPLGTGMSDLGYDMPSSYGGSIAIDNESTNSYTWSTVNRHPEFDSARVYEICLMADPVYMLITSAVQSPSTLSNSSSIALNWTYAPFLTSGQAYVQSRDNAIQGYEVDLPVAGLAQMTVVYGPCAGITSAGLAFFPEPMSNCWYSHVPTSGSPNNVIVASMNGASLSVGVHAYVTVDRTYSGATQLAIGSVPAGSVLKLTISSVVPIDWLAWGLFIAALVALVVVVIIMSRKK